MPPMPLSLGLSSARGRYGADNAVTVENAHSEVLMNGGKAQVAIYPAPGLKPWVTDTPGATRGLMSTEWGLYRAAGQTLSIVSESGARRTLGTLPGTGRASFARNNLAEPDIPIVSGGQVHILKGSTLTPFSLANMAPPVDALHIRGRFVYPISDGRFYYSRINETTVEADAFYNAEGMPDGLVGGYVRRNELWLMGTKSLEIWGPTEDADDPFSPMGGGARPYGCLSAASIAEIDDTIFWVDDKGMVRAAKGYEPQDISTPFVVRTINADPKKRDIEGHAYTIAGMHFYEISGSNFTLRYALATQQWADRKTRSMKRWVGAGAADFADSVIVPDLLSGNLYKLDEKHPYDGTVPIDMRFVSPIFHAFPAPLAIYSFHLDIITDPDPPAFSEAHEAMLRVTDDGGRTWSAPLMESIAHTGKLPRVTWRRLGSAERQGCALELTLPAPLVKCVMSAVVNGEDGTS